MSNASKDQPKFKVREFEWFEMETRVRQMVQELIAPFQKRVNENTSTIKTLSTLTSGEAEKLKQLQMMVTNDSGSSEVDAFRQIDKKFEKQHLQAMEIRNMIGEQAKMFEGRFELQDQRLKENSEILLNNMQLKLRVNEEIREQNTSIEQFRNQLQNVILELNSEVLKNHKEQQEADKRSRQAERELENRIATLESIQRLNERSFQQQAQKHLQLQGKDIHLEEEIARLEGMIAAVSSNLSYSKKLSHYIQELEQHIKMLEFDVKTLSPLVTQAQISDTLYNVLPEKQKVKVLVYTDNRYSHMNNEVIDKNYTCSREEFEGVKMLDNVHKLTTRELIRLKRKKLLEMGVEIDHVSYEMREKYFREVSIIEEGDDSDEQGKGKGKPTIDVNQINEMIKQNVADFEKQASRKIDEELKDSKKFMTEMEEQLQLALDQQNTSLESFRQSVHNFETEQLLENKYARQETERLHSRIDEVQVELKKNSENMFSFIQFCSLVNHLQIQDELDKQSISLLGVKESFHEESSQGQQNRPAQVINRKIVDFNPQCFSCCGYPASTIAAFKMACLTYNPSDITIEDKEYKREEILDISTKILQFIKGRLGDQSITVKDNVSVRKQTINMDKFEAVNQPQQGAPPSTVLPATQADKQPRPNRRTRRLMTSTTSSRFTGAGRGLRSASNKDSLPANISYIFTQNRRRNMAFLN